MSRSFLAAALVLCLAASVEARTARHLNGRIQIDGFTTHASGPADTSEWRDDEKVFGVRDGRPEESTFDSKWGSDNDVQQIRVTWDKDTLYVGVDAVIAGNNVLVWLDSNPVRGMFGMTGINSWRRGFQFSGNFAANAFRPDLFGATWDNNSSPHLVLGQQNPSQVVDLQTGTAFRAAATFSGNLRGRAMEFAIPWNTVFLGASDGPGVANTWVPSLAETVRVFPRGAVLLIAAAITGGNDGTGGPDTAPDKTGCHVSDGNQVVLVDNFAALPLDLIDDSGLGGGGPDGVADWDVSPRERITYRFDPPIPCKPLESAEFTLDRPAFAPERSETIRFDFEFKLRLDPNDPADQRRSVTVIGDVYDSRGRYIRTLFNSVRPALDQRDPCEYSVVPCQNVWDGRDEKGVVVAGGVYVMRVVLLEPFNTRLTRPVVVVR